MSGFTPSNGWLLATSTEPLLIVVIGLLALVVVGLAAIALVLRRRGKPESRALDDTAPVPALPPVKPPVVPGPRRRASVVRSGGGGGLAVATSTAMVCPTCRTEYHGMTYCTRDARRLIPPEEMLGNGLAHARGNARSAGLVCLACHRAYEPGLRNCPHDSNELVPFAVYNATRPRRPRNLTEPAGVIARICPVCATKFDLNARFCGHDAGELIVIN